MDSLQNFDIREDEPKLINNEFVERIDALTGCANLLSFLETFSTRLRSNPDSAFSLLLVDLNNFMAFNAEYGHARGNAVLHWVSIVLKDTNRPVYRIGGDEFLVLFDGEEPDAYGKIAQTVFERINRESKQFEWTNPASVIVIHFQKERLEIADL